MAEPIVDFAAEAAKWQASIALIGGAVANLLALAFVGLGLNARWAAGHRARYAIAAVFIRLTAVLMFAVLVLTPVDQQELLSTSAVVTAVLCAALNWVARSARTEGFALIKVGRGYLADGVSIVLAAVVLILYQRGAPASAWLQAFVWLQILWVVAAVVEAYVLVVVAGFAATQARPPGENGRTASESTRMPPSGSSAAPNSGKRSGGGAAKRPRRQ